MVEEKRERKQINDNNNKQTLSEKKKRGGRKCQRATGQRLDTRNPCTRYNPLGSDNNTAGQQTLTNYPTQRKTDREVSLNIETTPPLVHLKGTI